MIYTVLDVDYDNEADVTVMHATVYSAMADDEEMTEFVQRLLGYGITGDVSQEIFPIFTGNGRNSKGGCAIYVTTDRRLCMCVG